MTRSPQAVLDLVSGIDPVNNFAFLPHQRAVMENGQSRLTPRLTFCNCYATVVTAALGCAIPPKKANGQAVWLASNEGQLAGWMHVDSETARQRAALGYPTLAVWSNPGGSGHIALVVPPPAGEHRMFVSAAGAENFVSAPIERSFGRDKLVQFYTHE